jgi:hypothetical protein
MKNNTNSSMKILNRIKDGLKRKQNRLGVNVSKGCGIFFEIPLNDNMMGDQLLGHPCIKEMKENINN